MANIMKAHYIGEGEYFDADKSISELTTMLGDADFIYGSYHSVNAWSKNLNKPIYYYLFEHIGEFSFGDLFAMGKTKFDTTLQKDVCKTQSLKVFGHAKRTGSARQFQ